MADPSYNYSYTPTVDHRESNLYIEEYYSSTDTKIYMDDEEQTEIGFIQYEIQEQLKPVYGYNSRTFDDVVIGNRIVTGTFTVPIKNKSKQEFTVDQNPTYMGETSTINNDDVHTYNLNEENNLYNTDWFGSTARNINSHNNSNIDTDALIKLIVLGYDVTANSSTAQYTKALKQFQQDHDCGVTGSINEMTQQKLDEAFALESATEINLDSVYGYNDLSLTKGQTLLSGNGLILDYIPTANSNIYEVLDSNGKRFYIEGELLDG